MRNISSLRATANTLATHLAAGLAAADGGGEGAARGRTPTPPPGKPGEGLLPGTGAAGLGPCKQWNILTLLHDTHMAATW